MNNQRWPNEKRAAISITMDNMGEASEIHRGTWPAEAPIGHHFSVIEALPTMLEILAAHGVQATYFIEAFNAGVYFDAIRSVEDAGHEIAFHGWQHETWSTLDEMNERQLFQRSIERFREIGIAPLGFRPPGGVLTELTPSLLAKHGFTYCSPAARNAAIVDGIVYLPFEWQGIDAYYYSAGFGGLRSAKGDSEEPLAPEVFVDRAMSLIERCLDDGGYTALLFHPFLEMEPDRQDAMSQILDRIVRDERLWCAPGNEIADWIRSTPEPFRQGPAFDTTSWSRS